MTNWTAMQVPTEKGKKDKVLVPRGVKTRYLAAGSWRADGSKGGNLRPKARRGKKR